MEPFSSQLSLNIVNECVVEVENRIVGRSFRELHCATNKGVREAMISFKWAGMGPILATIFIQTL
jgi:hypothetical protein